MAAAEASAVPVLTALTGPVWTGPGGGLLFLDGLESEKESEETEESGEESENREDVDVDVDVDDDDDDEREDDGREDNSVAEIVAVFPPVPPAAAAAPPRPPAAARFDDMPPAEVLERVEALVLEFVRVLARGEPLPTLPVISRARANAFLAHSEACGGDAYMLRAAGTVARAPTGAAARRRKYLRTWIVLLAAAVTIREQRSVSLRDMYYRIGPRVFNHRQSHCDSTVQDAMSILGCSRRSLGVYASPRGVVAGRLSVRRGDTFRDFSDAPPTGLPISNETVALVSEGELYSDARLILLVEKECVFVRLVEDRVTDQVPCVVVTAKGFPDLNTRATAAILARRLRVPVAGLFDCNVGGVQIYLTYRRGSFTGPESAHFALPDLVWLGLRPSQLAALRMPPEATEHLRPRDTQAIDRLLDEDYIQWRPRVAEEIALLRHTRVGAELQVLHTRGELELSRWVVRTLLNRREWLQ